MKSLCEPQVTTLKLPTSKDLRKNLPISTNLFRCDGVGCEILIPILQNLKLFISCGLVCKKFQSIHVADQAHPTYIHLSYLIR
jgi:hypothetical protein